MPKNISKTRQHVKIVLIEVVNRIHSKHVFITDLLDNSQEMKNIGKTKALLSVIIQVCDHVNNITYRLHTLIIIIRDYFYSGFFHNQNEAESAVQKTKNKNKKIK